MARQDAVHQRGPGARHPHDEDRPGARMPVGCRQGGCLFCGGKDRVIKRRIMFHLSPFRSLRLGEPCHRLGRMVQILMRLGQGMTDPQGTIGIPGDRGKHCFQFRNLVVGFSLCRDLHDGGQRARV